MANRDRVTLPIDALATARRLSGQVLDDFGLEVGRCTDAPCESVWDAYVVAAKFGLACEKRAAQTGDNVVEIPVGSAPQLQELIDAVLTEGNPRDRLDPLAAINSCAVWGLREIERTVPRVGESYDLDSVRAAISREAIKCNLCGAQNPQPVAETCARCGAFLDC